MLAERLRLPFAILEPLIERIRAEHLIEVRGTTGTSSASYRYAHDRPRAQRARCSISRSISTPAPRRCRSRATSSRCARWPPRAASSIASACAGGFGHLIVSDHILEQLGPGRQREQGDLPLRASRQRQDRAGRRPRPDHRRRHVHAVRHRRRGSHRHDVRSDQSRAARRARSRARPASSPRSRRTAAGSASGVRS